MEKDSKIYLAGDNGLIGSALAGFLKKGGYGNIITKSRRQLDLRRQADVESFFDKERPEYVFLAAARVGGIAANINYPAEFIYDNLAIQTNVINSAYKAGVKKLLFFASACMYPKNCPQPMQESRILSGELEPTNEPYAMAKICGLKMCEAYNRQYKTNFICAVLTNAYGCKDDFQTEDSHVIPALIGKFHRAKISGADSVSVWGSGKPEREFIFADDVAGAAVFLMNTYNDPAPINVGSGRGVSIKELSLIVKEVIGYKGEVVFDSSKPDGIPRKVLDVSKLNTLGFKAGVSLEEGIKKTYETFQSQEEILNSRR
ncbi:MAG: GDP-L-fucose synthase [Candidatus Omnitrophica bacterium]|nr:GDP-L-fucose synthase [Candidatus Omnitrophota bacterium]